MQDIIILLIQVLESVSAAASARGGALLGFSV